MPIGNGHIRVTTTAHGLMAYLANDIYVGGSLEAYGEFSAEESEMMLSLFPKDAVVVDVGANIGAHSVAMARKAATVFAIEPQGNLFELLQTNMVLNSLNNLKVGQFAVGATAGTAWMPDLDPDSAQNYGGVALQSASNPGNNYPVTMTTLDNILNGLDRLDFIKIDVEGMEGHVLAGAIGIIGKFKPVLYVEDDRAENSYELRRFIREVLNYDIVEHNPPLFRTDNYNGNQENIWGANILSFNLICTPREVQDAA